MKEYGLFNDEGLMESNFYSVEEAQWALVNRYNKEDCLHVAQVCEEHREHEHDACEECYADEGD